MRIIDYAVKNYQFTLVIFAMVAVLGTVTTLTMPRSEDPAIHAPAFRVTAVYPGTSPGDMEELIVDPLEDEINDLEDIKRIRTTIRDGLAFMSVDFEYGSDVDIKHQELSRVTGSIRNQISGNENLSIEAIHLKPSDVNIFQIALISETAPRQMLQDYAEELEDQLRRLPQLKNIEIHGLPDQQVRVELKLEEMAQKQIPLNAVLTSLQGRMINIPAGRVKAGSRAFNIKTSGSYHNLREIENTVVFARPNGNYRLKDVADLYYGYENESYHTRLNGNRAIFVTAAQKEGENISRTQKAYKSVIDEFRATLPSNMDLVQHFEQAESVNRRLGILGRDFIIAILPVSVTLLPLGGRPAIIVMISIPLSLAVGIVLLNTFGYSLNQLSIVGLVVALGLLVDDSIVVVENIERWMLNGYSRIEATLKATKEISLAVVFCTVTLIIAFMPLVFLPEASGDFIRSLPLAVIFCVLASMVISLTIVPFLASRLLKKEHTGHPDGNRFMRGLKKIIHGGYSPLLERALKRPWVTLAIAGAVFGASLMLFNVVGASLFPASENPQFLVHITTPPQSDLSYTDQVTKAIEEDLMQEPEVHYFAANAGKGNPRIYYNDRQENERSNFAEIFVQLHEDTSPEAKIELIKKLRGQWTPYLGAEVEVQNFQQGPPVVAPVEVRQFGENLDTLRALAGQTEKLLKNTPGTIYVNNPVRLQRSDIRVDINHEKANMQDVPVASIDRTVRLAIAGLNLGQYADQDENDYNLLVTRTQSGRPALNAFNNLYVDNRQGKAVRLSQVAGIKLEATPQQINHQELERVVSVGADVREGVLASRVIDDVIRQMDEADLPAGYRYEMGGDVETSNDSFGGLLTIIIITLFLFIAVLILEFKTFKSTLIVLSVIPLGVVGAVVALWLTGNSLSFVATIGLIALAGIEVKNTILLVDFANQLRREGKNLDEAIREAGEIRFLPIVLTALTAIGGLTPIAISTNPLIAPLAIVIIGGLISSTLLSRIVTPVVYKLLPPAILRDV